MKINVTVDLDDFFPEDNHSFSEQIKEHIVFMVKQEMFAAFKKDLTEEFFKLIKEEFETQKDFFVKKTFDQLVLDAKIKKPYSGNELISISEWMCQELERIQLSENKLKDFLNTQVKNSADSISKELKIRYDLLFASQIVTKLNENGMLKEDVAKLLLNQ